MPVTQDTLQQIRKIDEQIIALLSQRVIACRKVLEEDEEGLGPEELADTVTHWVEEADERGLNMSVMNQMAKLTVKLCRATEE